MSSIAAAAWFLHHTVSDSLRPRLLCAPTPLLLHILIQILFHPSHHGLDKSKPGRIILILLYVLFSLRLVFLPFVLWGAMMGQSGGAHDEAMVGVKSQMRLQMEQLGEEEPEWTDWAEAIQPMII